ncbi:MAG: ClbS/DfsB family four-helix bundle protein [Chloroflexi bacterium]|nr:MAG: ClbS/DfsB family four-helix bundle protein [Chloroflexota bacterium]TMF38074.1 MAG: ClbS/DfsB family four-helix bundle protein [Chloroflexota bacterium]
MTAANREIEPIEKGWSALEAVVEKLGPQRLELTGSGRWAVKDHLVHIGAWERSLLALLDGADRRSAMGVPDAAEDTDSINEAVWLAHRSATPEEALAYSRASHVALMRRLGAMSDADLRRSYNHYQPNDPRDPGDDRPVVDWVAGNTYEHYAEHIDWINQLVQSSN